MSDAEHLIENAIMALERYPYEEAERYFMEAPINIMMSKDSGCPLNAVWEMAIFCDTTLRQDWKEKWEKEAERWIPVTERLPKENEKVLIYARVGIITVGWYTEIHGVYYNKGFETESGFMWLGTVPYWKPLPEEPKEGHDA